MKMMTRQTINIKGLSKPAILATLYNHSQPMGLGFLQAREGEMTEEIAAKLFNDGGIDDNFRIFNHKFGRFDEGEFYFDYVYGRPLKARFHGDEFDPWGYDRDNGGEGTAARLIDELRKEGADETD